MRAGLRAALAVEDRMFRALAVLRFVLLAYALVTALVRVDALRRPGLALAGLAVMTVWSLVATWAYVRPERRGPLLLGTDLAVAVALLALTPLVKGGGFDASLPGYWVVAPLMAWAARYQWRGGLVAGVVIAAVDLGLRRSIDQTDVGNVFLIVIGGPIVGFMCASLKQMAGERDVAQRAAAAAEERTRLARVVHDGVLQVLAMVQRRGTELGGGGAELARLAGDQERALRTLIRAQDAVGAVDDDAGSRDLAVLLGACADRPGVEVVLPAGPVELPAAAADELAAAVGACLDNVTTHVGDGAPAWVLLEAFDDRVEVSVRDEGPGIPSGRLEVAEADGRLGVAESIRGRLRDLGGTAELSTGPWGTEWELSAPR